MKYLVVGLGNPGGEYEGTRHNIGFMVLDTFSVSESWDESSGIEAQYLTLKLKKNLVELLKPMTFMNKSGEAVFYAKNKNRIKIENIIVVHDDVDLPFGSLKISFGRGSGGHKGIESIFNSLRTKYFVRVRIGVVPITPSGKLRKPQGGQKVLDHLMSRFSKKETLALKGITKKAVEAVKSIVVDGREVAMNQFN